MGWELPAGTRGTPLPINSPLATTDSSATSFKGDDRSDAAAQREYVIYGTQRQRRHLDQPGRGQDVRHRVGNNRVANRPEQAPTLPSPFATTRSTRRPVNIRRVFAAFRGEGVYQSSDFGISWQFMAGAIGNPLIRNYDETKLPATTPIPVTVGLNPGGPKGRIVLATPALSGVTTSTNRITDLGLQGWLYALVATPGGRTDGLYVTKDFGQNWTRVRIPQGAAGALGLPSGIPSNNESLTDYDVLGTSNFAQGNYNITLTIDPNNPTWSTSAARPTASRGP
jgi:hypothetical protein